MADEHEQLESADDRLIARLESLWPTTVDRTRKTDASSVKRVAHFELQRPLGSGTFGIVYLAFDTQLKRQVAIKLPRLEVLIEADKRSYFANEASIAAKLNHPGIVPIYAAQLDGPEPFIVSAYCGGLNLAQWLQRESQKNTWRASLELMRQVADAVQYAHEQGVLHRDLKPANVMLVIRRCSLGSSQEQVDAPEEIVAQVTDFGLASVLGDRGLGTRSSRLVGTPIYMSPESLTCSGKDDLTAASDVYSMGVMLFEMLTGKLPIEGESYVEILDNLRRQLPFRVSQLRPNLPPELSIVCAKCLEKNPVDRYRSASELSNDLQRCLSGQTITTRLPSVLRRLQIWSERPKRIINAGWFAIIWQSIVIAWATLSLMLLPTQTAISKSQWLSLAGDLVWGAFFSVGPVLLLGWFTVQKQRWAIYSGLILSIAKFPFFVRAMFERPLYFGGFYEQAGLFSFIDHCLFVFCLAIQISLYVCAAIAIKRITKL